MTSTTDTTTTDTMGLVWHHLDQLHDDDGIHLLTTSIESVEAVRAALLTG